MLTKLGKYTIKSELGHGAMGVVYLAEDPRMHRAVALKTMSPSVAGVPDLLQRFYREAESAGRLHHPNIVTIYEIDEADGIPYIAMDFIEGESLERIVLDRKDLSIYTKVDVMIQVCRGLHYAHKFGIVHRDVKPANIMVRNDGVVNIVDFGIARVGEGSMTRAGLILGTPMYMSPEHIRGKTVDARTDIFAAGVILYELLTYTSPFFADNVPAIIYKVLNETPPPVSSLVEDCPAALDAIIARAMAKNLDERYQTADDLAFDLQQQADFLKRHVMDRYVDEGQRLIKEGKLARARESIQKALEIDSRHDLAKSMLLRVQEQMRIQQSQESIEKSLRQAREALQAKRYDEAMEAVEEVLSLSPGNAQALEDRDIILAQREREKEQARHLERAEELAIAGDLAGVQAEAESLLAFDPEHKRALQLLEWARRELIEQDRQRQLQKHLELAEGAISRKEFAAAVELLEKARALDPVNLGIESQLRAARESLYKEERKKLLNRQLGEIQDAFNAGDFDRAIEIADACLQDFPRNPNATRMRAQAVQQRDVERERLYVEQQLQASTELFQKNDFPAAIAILEKTLGAVPGEPRLTDYLKVVRDAQEAAMREEFRRAAIAQSHDLILAGDFAGAITVLEAAVQRSGDSPELAGQLQSARDQQAQWRREWQARQALNRAHSFLQDENYDEAIHLLEQSEAENPLGEVAEALSNARARRQEYDERREETLRQALEWLQNGAPAKALSVLDAAPKSYFKDSRFSQAYSECREALDRFAAIRLATEQMDKAMEKENWGEATRLLRTALATYPDDPLLLAAGQKLQEAQTAARRTVLLKQLEEARTALDRKQYRRVGERLSSPDWQSAEFSDLTRQAVALIEEARQREREQEIARRREETLLEALQWLDHGDPAKAFSVLDSAPREYRNDARFSRALSQSRQALDRQNAIRQTTEQMDSAMAGENWGEAQRLLNAALGAYDDDPLLASAAQKLQQAQNSARRGLLLKQLQEARAAYDQMQYRRVGDCLSSPDWQAPEFIDLTRQAVALIEEARQREREQEVARRREETLQEALQFLQNGNADKAFSTLDSAPREYRNDARFAQVYAQCREALDRNEAIRQAVEQVEKIITAGNLVEAERVLRLSLTAYPDDPLLIAAGQKLQSARTAARRTALQKQLDEARAAFEQMQYARVREGLSSPDWQSSEFPDLSTQAKELIEEASKREQEQEIARQRDETLQKALKLLEKGNPVKAFNVLDSAPREYRNDARFFQVYTQCREAVDRLNAIRQTLEQMDKALAGENWSEAERLLNAALSAYGEDPMLATAGKKLQQAQTAARRSRLVKQLNEAQAAFDRMQYREVVDLLSPSKWQSGGFSDLAMQAAALAERASQREQEAARRARLIKSLEEARAALERMQFREVKDRLSAPEWQSREFPDISKQAAALLEETRKREQEAGRRSRLAKQLEDAQAALGHMEFREVREKLTSPEWQAGEFPDLSKQAAALVEEARKLEQEVARQQALVEAASPAPPPPPPPTVAPPSTLDAQKRLRDALKSGPARREKEAPKGDAQPTAPVAQPPSAPAAVMAPVPPAPTPVATPPAPVAPKPKVAAAVAAAPAPAAAIPKPVPAPPESKPMALWVGIGIIAVVLLGAGVWWATRGKGGTGGAGAAVGYAQVTAVPWAEIVSVKAKEDGKVLHLKGQTPLELKLPPGDYVIDLKNDQGTGETEVSVKSGEVVPVVYKFDNANVDAWVDELVSK